jgi:heme exporter protein D
MYMHVFESYKMRFFKSGLGATFVTSGFASAIWWLLYENIKSRMYQNADQKQIHQHQQHQQQQQQQQQQSELSIQAATTELQTNVSTSFITQSSMYQAVFGVNRTPQLVAGFLAGSITSTLLNPLDVVVR